MKKSVRAVVILLAAVFLLAAAVLAEDAFDGYLIAFRDEVCEREALAYVKETGREESLASFSPKMLWYKTYDESLARELDERDYLRFYEKDYYITIDMPKEAPFASLMSTAGAYDQWSHEVCNASLAWKLGVSGKNVRVAVVDSGVYADHEDLSGNIVLPGGNYYASGQDTSDNVGHGTYVSGIIAAKANGIGVTGLAYDASIVPIKITDTKTFSLGYMALALIESADDFDADVVNMSFGYVADGAGTETQAVHKSIKEAVDLIVNAYGVIMVAASGNAGTEVYNYPASFDNVVSVGSVTYNGNGRYSLSSFSNHNDAVDVVAPGASIVSTNRLGTYWNVGGLSSSGTSFSSPYVAAAAALARSVDPTLDYARFLQLVDKTADKTLVTEGQKRDDKVGYGLINVGGMICELLDEKYDELYVAPLYEEADGRTTVTLLNTTETPLAFTVIGTATAENGRVTAVRTASVSLAKGTTAEVDVSSLVSADHSAIRLYFLDSALRPIRDAVTR